MNISYSDHARRRKVDSSQIHQNDEGFGGKPSTRLRYFRKWAFGWPWIRRNSRAKFETKYFALLGQNENNFREQSIISLNANIQFCE